MSIVQGGRGIAFLAEAVYQYLCTGKCTDVAVNCRELGDSTLSLAGLGQLDNIIVSIHLKSIRKVVIDYWTTFYIYQ